MLSSMKVTNSLPDLKKEKLSWLPIDVAAEAVLEVSLSQTRQGENDQAIPVYQILKLFYMNKMVRPPLLAAPSLARLPCSLTSRMGYSAGELEGRRSESSSEEVLGVVETSRFPKRPALSYFYTQAVSAIFAENQPFA